MKLMESVVNGLTTTLQNNVAANLAAIEVATADDITLDPPRLFLDYKALPGEFSEWPCVCVVASTTTPLVDNGNWMELYHNVAIITYLQEADPRALALKLLRYQRAVIEVLAKNRTGVLDEDGQSAWAGINFTGTDPGRRFNVEGSEGVFGDWTIVYARALKGEDL